MVSRHRGPLVAWRISDHRHPVFDGAGASAHGARWNSPGYSVIYASQGFACAILERLAHAGINKVPKNQAFIRIEIPDDVLIEEVGPEDVPGWNHENFIVSRAYSDNWVRSQRTCVLVVPSAAVRFEKNVLINQAHPDFRKLKAS